MRNGGVERRKSQRKWIDAGFSARRGKWCREERCARARVAQSIRRLRLVKRNRISLNHRIKNPIPRPNAGFSRAADYFAEPAVGFVRGIGQAEARRKSI